MTNITFHQFLTTEQLIKLFATDFSTPSPTVNLADTSMVLCSQASFSVE